MVEDHLEGVWCWENSFGVDGKEEERERSRMKRNRKTGGHIPTTISIALSPTQGIEENRQDMRPRLHPGGRRN